MRPQSSAWRSAAKRRSWNTVKEKSNRSAQKPGSIWQGLAAGGTVHGFVHWQDFEVEQENVGDRGGPLPGTGGEKLPLRRGSRFIKKKVQTPGKGCPAGGVQIYQGHGRLSLQMAAQEIRNDTQPCFPDVAAAPHEKTGQKQAKRASMAGRPKRPPPPRKRPGPRRWALSSGGIPWGASWSPGLRPAPFMMQSCSSSPDAKLAQGPWALLPTHQRTRTSLGRSKGALMGMGGSLCYLDTCRKCQGT